MCKKCTQFVTAAIKAGATRDVAMGILWEHTAYPFEHPTDQQIDKVSRTKFKV